MYQAGDRFRIKTPTIALTADENGVKVAAIVPAGAVIGLIEEITELNSLVLVNWGATSCWMFAQDIHKRGEREVIEPAMTVRALARGSGGR